MTEYIKEIICRTETDTKHLAENIASIVQKGDVFALFGTLGVGKSTFSRYFIQFLCGAEDVPSPTFTLVQTYEAQEFDIYHYDMYRLKNAQDAYELGIEDAFYQGVCLIEWPENILSVLPRNIWKMEIVSKDNIRHFKISVTDEKTAARLRKIALD